MAFATSLMAYGLSATAVDPSKSALDHAAVSTAESAGYTRITHGVPIVADTMKWFRNHYLPLPQHPQEARASPLPAANVQGLLPAFIVTARHDPLCEEGIAYARRIEAAGTIVTHLSLGGQTHGFLTLGGLMEAASVTLDLAGRAAALWLSFVKRESEPSL